MSLRRIPAVLGVALLTALLPAGPADAAVGCGSVITRSTSLTGDLTCPGSTITISGDNVVLEFNGHTISGDGTTPGIRVEGANVRLQRGTITGFTSGVAVLGGDGAPSVHLSAMTVSGNHIGVDAANALARVSGSRVVDNVVGLGSESGEGGPFKVNGSLLARNRIAVDVNAGSNGVSVAQSVVEANSLGISCSQDSFVVTASKIRRNGVGVAGYQCDGSSVVGSHLVSNGTALDLQQSLDGPAYLIEDNYLLSNGTAVNLHFMAAVAITDNQFRYNGVGVGTSPNDDGAPAASGQINDNDFYANGDGVFLDEPTTFAISDNRAWRNTNWGIYTVSAASGAGNVAFENGQPAQCFGVTCAPA